MQSPPLDPKMDSIDDDPFSQSIAGLQSETQSQTQLQNPNTNGLIVEEGTPQAKPEEEGETPDLKKEEDGSDIETDGDEAGSVDDGEDSEDEEGEYEKQRQETIRKNAELLNSLGLGGSYSLPSSSASIPKSTTSSAKSPSQSVLAKRRMREQRQQLQQVSTEEPRRSSRVAALKTNPSLKRKPNSSGSDDGGGSGSGSLEYLPDDWDDRQIGSSKHRQLVLPKGKKISVPSVEYAPIDPNAQGRGRLQKKAKLAPGAPIGTSSESDVMTSEDYGVKQPKAVRMKDGSGRMVFGGRWKGVFEPNVDPEEMFLGGAFGGGFYADNYSQVLHKPLHSHTDILDLPPSLRTSKPASNPSFSPATHLTASSRTPTVNRFKVNAGQSLQDWEKSGWIWEGDPRGWAQWYVRFCEGRRCEDDERQVQRWLNLAGPNGRFSKALLKKIANHPGAGGLASGNTAIMDEDVGRVMRQVCWQWGWQVNEAEWKRRVVGALAVGRGA